MFLQNFPNRSRILLYSIDEATVRSKKRWTRTNEALEPRLKELLAGEGRLREAMRYAVLGGGKRFRPFLVLESATLLRDPAR